MNVTRWLAELDEAKKADDQSKVHRLQRMLIQSVHLVGRGANRRNFAVRKGEDEMLTDDIIGLDVVQTEKGLVTVGKANRTSVAEAMTELAKMLGDPEADETKLADTTKAVWAMLAPAQKAEGGTEGGGEEDEEDAKAKAKKAKAKAGDGEDDDADDEAAKAKAKKAKADDEEDEDEGGEPTPKKKSDEENITDAFAFISKAGQRMASGRLAIFSQAMKLLKQLAKELDPAEQKKVEPFLQVAKSLTDEGGKEGVPGGNSATSVAKSEGDRPKGSSAWSTGVNLNNRNFDPKTADPETSFFD